MKYSKLRCFQEYRFFQDYLKFKSMVNQEQRFELKFSDRKKILFDATETTDFDPHYTYFPAWAARKVNEIDPKKHVDFSSILHFSTLLSAFVPTEFYDYRPAKIDLLNLNVGKADLTKLLFANGEFESVSCMHVVEHIGLGRYGDELDPQGDLKAIGELKRVIKINGNLLLVVPVGKPKIMFNAHRIYSYEQIVGQFEGWDVREFSLVSSKNKKFITNANPKMVKNEDYGCGCFWLQKKK